MDSLPLLDTLHEDLIERVVEQENSVAASVELLHENALCKVVGALANIGKVEDLDTYE